MATFLDACRFVPTAGGTADWTYSSAVGGFQSPAAAGAANGRAYKYRAESNDLSQWEIGEGTWNSAAGVLSRATVLFSSSGTTSKVNFVGAPQVAVVALKEDLISIDEANSFSDVQKAQARINISAAPHHALAAQNILVNPNFELSQEFAGALVTLPNNGVKYAVDGWRSQYVHSANTAVLTAGQSAGGGPDANAYCLSMIANTAMPSPLAAGDFAGQIQAIEGSRFARLNWGSAAAQPLVFGIEVLAPAGGGTMCISIRNTNFTRSYVIPVTLAGGIWEYKTVVFPGCTDGTWPRDNTVAAYLTVCFAAGSTFQTASPNTWVAGSSPGFMATPAQTNFMGTSSSSVYLARSYQFAGSDVPPQSMVPFLQPTFHDAWMLCRRYFEKSYDLANAVGSNVIPGGAVGATVPSNTVAVAQDSAAVLFSVPKRAAPTVTVYGLNGTAGAVSSQGGVDQAANTGVAIGISEKGFGVRNGSGTAYTTGGNIIYFQYKADARL